MNCFEVSWEVCNKVGGIYTVVSSKAAQMVARYGDGYIAVGPYFAQRALGAFEELPPSDKLKQAFESLRFEGIECHYGTWLVPGNPRAILLDTTGFANQKDSIKRHLWDRYKIDTLGTDWYDVDEPLVWSWAVGRLIEKLSDKAVCHCHEWLAAGTLLYLRSHNIPVGTVFTTHATALGRTLASENRLYDEKIDPDAEVSKRGQGLKAKHQIEKTAAHETHVFTTVSEITGMEAERLLGKKPDVLLPNGLDFAKYPTFEEISVRHKLLKGKIFDFLLAYFFPYYAFELNDTLVFFIAGRYEFHDKGIDIFIQALGKLNDKMKAEKSTKTVVAFFWVPGMVKAINPDLLESKTWYRELKEMLADNRDTVEHNILHALISNQQYTEQRLFPDIHEELKRKVMRFGKKGLPPICTHELSNEKQDLIIQTLLAVGLDNSADDRVKAIYYPTYLNGADGLLDLSYYEAMQGAHLGVFPSYYEPWGYTPLEAGALGVPSVTTDLAGFGRFVISECPPSKTPGIWILKRWQRADDDVVAQLMDVLHKYTHMPKPERIENKLAAHAIASLCDWKQFVEKYVEAEELAISRISPKGI